MTGSKEQSFSFLNKFNIMTGSKSKNSSFHRQGALLRSGLDKGGFYCFGESQSFVFCVVSGSG